MINNLVDTNLLSSSTKKSKYCFGSISINPYIKLINQIIFRPNISIMLFLAIG